MKKIYINPINKLITLDKEIYSLEVENISLFREMVFNYKDAFIYSVNNNPENIEKKVLIIQNPLAISVNDSKFIKLLYKNIEKRINTLYKSELNDVESSIKDLLGNFIYDTIIQVDYAENIDINKLLSCIGVSYKESNDYFENLVNYLKLYKDLSDCTLIISYGLLKLLSKEEINLLSKELLYHDLALLDISYRNDNNTYDIIVDDDWCIL